MSENVVLLIMPLLTTEKNDELDDGCERFLRFMNRTSHKTVSEMN